MDFLEFFNLNEVPFKITPDPFYFYPSSEHNEILSSLNYVVDHKEGFFMLTGEPGTGKTTVIKLFINSWKDKAIIALILTPRLSPEDFLLAVMEDLDVKIKNTNKNDIIRTFRDFLIENAMLGKRVIIIVDEAQDLPTETLEELRLLSNLETDKEKLLQIILIGQPELQKRLAEDNLKQLDQRITVRAYLRPLTMDETSNYINYRLVRSGKGVPSFDRRACRLVYTFSKGIPRLINIVCLRAMMAAYITRSNNIKKRHVIRALEHVPKGYAKTSRITQEIRYTVLTAILFFASILAIAVSYRSDIFNGKWSPSLDGSAVSNPLQTAEPVESVQRYNGTLEIPIDNARQQGSERYNSQEQDVVVRGDAGEKPEEMKAAGRELGLEEEKEKQKTGMSESGQQIQTAAVIVKAANIRAKPHLGADKITRVSKDAALKIIDETLDAEGMRWNKVKLPDGKEGWIAGKLIKTDE